MRADKYYVTDDPKRSENQDRMGELRDNLDQKNTKWDHIVHGKMLLGITLDPKRLPR